MEETTPTVRRCSLCGEEGHIRSNRLFHPIEEVSIVVEEIPTEEPILDTPLTEEVVVEEIPTEEPILDTPLTIEIPTEEVVIETLPPPPLLVRAKSVFNTLNYSKKKPTEYHQLKVGR
jgi:hypothetical protein